MKAAHTYATTQGCHGFVADQPLWSLAQPNPAAFGMPGLAAMDEPMFAFHQQSGWAVIPYTSRARLQQSGDPRLGRLERPRPARLWEHDQ